MTELSREEVLRIARECFGDKQFSAITYESGPYDITEPTVNLLTFTAAIYEAGIKKGKSIPMKYRRMEFNAQLQDELAAERAVSDRLLDQLRKIVTTDKEAIKGLELMQITVDPQTLALTDESAELIAEVESMRKEKPE